MDLKVGRNRNWEKVPETAKEVEHAACEEVANCVDFFDSNTVRFGPDGLYLLAGGKVHLLTVDVTFVRTLATDEEVPVTFVPDGQ